MTHNLLVIKEEIRKTLRILMCYPIQIVGFALFPLMWVIPFVFQGKALAGGLTSEAFGSMAGTPDYIPYVLVGAIVSTYIFSSLYGMAGSLREEQYWGTLELVLSSPANKMAILFGKAITDSIISTLLVVSQALLCIIVFGVRVSIGQILPILLVIVLMIGGLYGVALGLAALTLQIKETRHLVHSLNFLIFLFSPIRYPAEVHPVIKTVSLFIPITYALTAIRGLTLLEWPVSSIWGHVLVLLVIDVVLICSGYVVFHWVEKRVRRTGVVGHY